MNVLRGAKLAEQGVKKIMEKGPVLAAIAVPVAKFLDKKADERNLLIEIPGIRGAKLEDAKGWLKDADLKVAWVIAKPNIAFKDCSDSEVVSSKPKAKQKVKPGTHVVLEYVTSEVIEASRKLFEEAEAKKAEKKIKHDEQLAEFAQAVNDKVLNVQAGAKKAVSKIKNKKQGESSKYKSRV